MNRVRILAPLLALGVNAQFSLYPGISSTALATALGISSECLSSLNATVDCDQSLFSMAGNVDGFFWSDDNATALCTSDCLSSAASWFSNAASACSYDQLNAYGRLYPADTVPGRYVDGLNIVCVTADSDLSQAIGINGTAFDSTVIDSTNSTVTAYDADDTPLSPAAEASIQPVPYNNLYSRQASTSSSYCLVESYDWVGSDIIRPDCSDSANANASQCIDPTDVPPENARIANLYTDDLLCSPCFLNMYYLRAASPFLPDSDASDDLVAQWYDILDVCNAAMPDLLVRQLPFYDPAPGTSNNYDVNSTSNYPQPQALTGNQTYNSTCPYGVITLADVDLTIDFATQAPCDVWAQTYNSSAGNFVRALGALDCAPTFNASLVPAICAPSECSGGAMPDNTTCTDFAASLPGNVTTTQFLSWNPNLVGLCDVTTGQYVCIGAPGGTYQPPPSSNSSTNEGTQQRGGGNGPGTSTGTGTVGGDQRNSTHVGLGEAAPSPTQSGITTQCTQYAQAQSGDGCYSFSQDFGLTQQAFESWNPVLGTNGENCTTQFFAGYYYCVGVQSSSSTTTVTPTPTSSVATTPSPVQSGIDSQCTTYAEAVSGDTCSSFASANGITPDQLYTWNPALGTDGANCANSFWANEYYCVGAPDGTATTTTSAPTTSSTTVAIPSPTQSGIVSNCNSYAEAVSGDSCYGFANDNGITQADLYTWNTILGDNGENCSTEFQAQYYYCIGVSGASN